jgi:hypothetical protein
MNSTDAKFISDAKLHAGDIFRDGPRYWVGRIEHEGKSAILKTIIDDSSWTSSISGRTFHPSDQLRMEVRVVEALHAHRGQIQGMTTDLIRYSSGDEPWMLREMWKSKSMAAGGSPLVFKPDFFHMDMTEGLVSYIQCLQALTPAFAPMLLESPLLEQSQLAFIMDHSDLDQPTDLLEPYAERMIEYLLERRGLHDSCLTVLAHGQVFPPHIYRENGMIGLIDWENVNLDTHLHDYVSIWVRGYRHSDWQFAFVDYLVQHGILADDRSRELWNIEILCQASSILNYLFWSNLESAEEQAAAIAALRRQINSVLAAS